MADCNTCNQYMSTEDILRRSIKCDANGNVALNGGLLNVPPAILSDGNTVAWYDSQDLTTITKDVNNKVSRWNDKLESGHDLIQDTGTKQPLWSVDGITFDGSDDILKTLPFTFNQPESIYLLFKQISHTHIKYIIDGNLVASGTLYQLNEPNKIAVYAGINSTESTDALIDRYSVIRVVFNAETSQFVVDNTASISGNFGSKTMGGVTLGPANVLIKEVIFRKVVDSEINNEAIYNYLNKVATLKNKLPIQTAGICLSFDDINYINDHIIADNVLKAYGWKATFSINTNAANTTLQQDIDQINSASTSLQVLKSKGHEIGNHTLRHKSLAEHLIIDGGTRQQYYDNYIAPLQEILNNTLGSYPKSYLYSSWFGEDHLMSNIILANGFTNVRHNILTYPTDLFKISYYNNKHLSLDISPYNGNTFTDEQILSILNYAKDNNCVVFIFSHHIVDTPTPAPTEVSLTRMQTICQFIQNNGMRFYTMSELGT